MLKCCISLIAFTMAITFWAPVMVRAAPPAQASIAPDHIVKGTTPTLTITLDQNISQADQNEIRKVRVGEQIVAVNPPVQGGKIFLVPPTLEFDGVVDVEVLGKDDQPVATGHLTYVAPDKIEASNGVKFILYVVIIAILPLGATLYDTRKSYEERQKVLDIVPHDASIAEIQDLLKDMDRGPTGFTGLTRGIVALTLLLILAIAIFHLIVFQPMVSETANDLLMLVAGTLTAITGFYFGTKAATEAAQKAAPTGTAHPGSMSLKLKGVEPKKGAPNTTVILTGEGFGAEKGKVMFDTIEGTGADWGETTIKVHVPTGLKPNTKVNIVVKTKAGTPSNPLVFHVTLPQHEGS